MAWSKFRPRTSYDAPEIEVARQNEILTKLALDKILDDEEAGEFAMHKAKQEYERSKRKGIAAQEFNRVVFKDLKRKNGAPAGDDQLMVPSIKCIAATPGETDGGNVKPDALVVAEVRVNDYVMLTANNNNMSKVRGCESRSDELRNCFSNSQPCRAGTSHRNVYASALEIYLMHNPIKSPIQLASLFVDAWDRPGCGQSHTSQDEGRAAICGKVDA